MESLYAHITFAYSHCVVNILPLCTHTEKLLERSQVHSDAFGGTHHCVGLARRGLPICNNAHIVAIHTGSNDWTDLRKHLKCRREKEVKLYRKGTLISMHIKCTSFLAEQNS